LTDFEKGEREEKLHEGFEETSPKAKAPSYWLRLCSAAPERW
jgi:hypothetical protein